MNLTPTVIIDTREQWPLTFGNLPSEPGTLATGDYSIRGLENHVAVERKGLEDLLQVVGRERDRFVRELQRLRAYRFRLLVIEATAADLERGDWRGLITPAQVLGSLASWTAQFQLPIWLVGDHDAAGRYVERFLYQAARTFGREVEAVQAFTADAMQKTARRRKSETAEAVGAPA